MHEVCRRTAARRIQHQYLYRVVTWRLTNVSKLRQLITWTSLFCPSFRFSRHYQEGIRQHQHVRREQLVRIRYLNGPYMCYLYSLSFLATPRLPHFCHSKRLKVKLIANSDI
jgi:hypothetical protein